MGQIIISICREYASAGHIIGHKLAEKMGISFYDSNLLDEMAAADADNKLNIDRMQKFDEQPKPFFARTVRGMKGSPEENVAQIQFDFLRYKAESGESFVIVGRCAEEALSGFPCLIKIFVLADEEDKLKRICDEEGVSEDEARFIMLKNDRTRRAYHNSFCSTKWGEPHGYDLCVNSSKLGIDKTTDLIENYIKMKMG